VFDAIDSVKAKAALIAYCREHAIPLIVIGGAGGQLDPTKIEVRDLARTEQEPLLKKVRKILRAQYGFARGEKHKYHIDAVFSMEPLRYPEAGDACEIDANSITGLNCAGFGSSMVVTATFGMVAAATCCARWPRRRMPCRAGTRPRAWPIRRLPPTTLCKLRWPCYHRFSFEILNHERGSMIRRIAFLSLLLAAGHRRRAGPRRPRPRPSAADHPANPAAAPSSAATANPNNPGPAAEAQSTAPQVQIIDPWSARARKPPSAARRRQLHRLVLQAAGHQAARPQVRLLADPAATPLEFRSAPARSSRAGSRAWPA
jgi:hypothetical protein